MDISDKEAGPPQTNIVVNGPELNPQDKNKPEFFKLSKITFLIIAIVLIFFSSSLVMGVQYVMTTPEKIMKEAYDKFISSKRFVFHISLAAEEKTGQVSIDADIRTKKDELSLINMRIDKVDNDPNLSFGTTILIGQKDLYLLPAVSKFDYLTKKIAAFNPELSSLKTYQMIKPVLQGENYLRIDLDEYAATTSAILREKIATDEQYAELGKKFFSSVKIRQFDRNFRENDTSYYRITLGFKKKELLDFINYFKELDMEIKLADINRLIRVVDSVNNWDDDLLDLLINKKTQELVSISVFMPYISEKTVKEAILKNKSPQATSSAIETLMPVSFGNILENKNSGQKQYIGSLEFTNFNDGPPIPAPRNIVEFSSLVRAIEEEMSNSQMNFAGNKLRIFDSGAIETKRLWESGSYEKSLQSARALLNSAENDKDRAVAHYWTGLSLYMLRNYDEAEKEELEAIRLDQNYGAPYSTLAVITLVKGDNQKAYELAKKSVNLSPDYAWAHNSLGVVLIVLGRKEEAISEFRIAVSLSPDSFVFQDNLNRALGNATAGTVNIGNDKASFQTGNSPSSSFSSAGQKTVEEGLTATINNAEKINNTIQITVTFANTSNSVKTAALIRLQMRSPSQGTPHIENYFMQNFNPNEVSQLKMTYNLLEGSPYTWHYLNTAGEDIILGTYTP